MSPLLFERWRRRYLKLLSRRGHQTTLPARRAGFGRFGLSEWGLGGRYTLGELLQRLAGLFDGGMLHGSRPQLALAFAGGPPLAAVAPIARAVQDPEREMVFREFAVNDAVGALLDAAPEVPPDAPMDSPPQPPALSPRPIARPGLIALDPEAHEPIPPSEKPRPNDAAPPRRVGRAWVGITGLIVAALLGLAWLMPAGGPSTKPIGEVQVGERVVAKNPTGEVDPDFGLEVDPATWRQVTLRARKRGGGQCHIELLRPAWWLRKNGAAVGRRVHIAIPECGVDDEALVLSTGPCPPIRPGDGPVVTGKFIHAAADVVDVHVEGSDQPIGTTPNHRFWSVDRREFIRADELKSGERLSARGHTVRFQSAVPRPRPERVYNLEVQGEHVYRVASLGVLVHNSGPGCPTDAVKAGDDVEFVTLYKGLTPDQQKKIVDEGKGYLPEDFIPDREGKIPGADFATRSHVAGDYAYRGGAPMS